jgi:hypothetical protein
MKLKLILIIIIFVLAAYFGYPVAKNHFFKGTTKEIINTIPESSKGDTNFNNQENSSNDTFSNNNTPADTVAPDIKVGPKDCDNDCSKFKKNNEKEYCQEICGTTTYFEDASDSGGSAEDCTSEKGIQKDYCLKDIATGNKDFKACNEISDENIKKSCKNRITEDLLEEQQK